MTRKRKTKSTDSAIKPPVLDLEATEVADPQDQGTQAPEPPADDGLTASDEAATAGPATNNVATDSPNAAASEMADDGDAGVEAEAADEPSEEAVDEEDAALPAQASGHKRLVAGAVVIGLLVAAGGGAWLYRSYGEQWFGSPATSAALEALQTRLATLEKAQATAGQDLASIGVQARAAADSLARANTELSGLAGTVKEIRQAAKANDAAIAGLQGRLDGLEASGQQSAKEIAGLKTALASAVQTDNTSGDKGAAVSLQVGQLSGNLDALGQRVKALEEGLGTARDALKGLSARLDDVAKRASGPQAGSKAAKIATAFSALETRIGEGKPFGAEVATLAGLDPNLPGLTALKAAADKGVPGVDDLAQQLNDALAQLPDASSKSAEAGHEGWWAGLKHRVFSVVKVRRIGATDWHEAGIAAKAALARDDIAGAIAAFGPVTDATPPAIASWLAAATARKQVLDRLSALSAAVLQSLKRNAS